MTTRRDEDVGDEALWMKQTKRGDETKTITTSVNVFSQSFDESAS